MFKTLINLYSTNLPRAIMITISLIIILSLMIWVSIIDIKKKTITFWKMLIASSSTIIMPLLTSFTCGCPYLKYFLIGALVLWVMFLAFNILFNLEKTVGKADIDILSAIISDCIMVTLWLFIVVKQYSVVKVTQLWYLFFFYLLLGSIIFIAITILITIIKCIINKNSSFLKELMHQKVPIIAMFIPLAVMIPYNIMIL